MVTDDLPKFDAHGTDLSRVRALLARGYSDSLIAEVLGISVDNARYAVVVALDLREGSPSPEEIAAGRAEIQAAWSAQTFIDARRGVPRKSARFVRARRKRCDERAPRIKPQGARAS